MKNRIVKVKHFILNDAGDITLLVIEDDIEKTVQCEAIGHEGWFPDKDDVVEIIKNGGGLAVQPFQWKSEQKIEEKIQLATERKAARQAKKQDILQREQQNQDFERIKEENRKGDWDKIKGEVKKQRDSEKAERDAVLAEEDRKKKKPL